MDSKRIIEQVFYRPRMNLFSVKALYLEGRWYKGGQRPRVTWFAGACGHLWSSQARDVVVHIQNIWQDPFYLDTWKVP